MNKQTFKITLTEQDLKDFEEFDGYFRVGYNKQSTSSPVYNKETNSFEEVSGYVYVKPGEYNAYIYPDSPVGPQIYIPFYLEVDGKMTISEFLSSTKEVEINHAPTGNEMFFEEFRDKIAILMINKKPEYFL